MPAVGQGTWNKGGGSPRRTTPWNTGAPPSTGPSTPGAVWATTRANPHDRPAQTPAPIPPLNIDTEYLDAFNASLGGARGSVDTQLAQGLQTLQTNADNSAKVLATLPTALQQSYAGADQSLKAAQGAATAGLSKDNRGAVASPQAIAPMSIALQSNKAGNAATAPLLESARVAQLGAGQTQLQAAAIEARARLDAEARSAAMQRLGMEHDAQMAQWNAAREDQRYRDEQARSDQQRREERRWQVEDRNYEQDVLDQRMEQEQARAERTAVGYSGSDAAWRAAESDPAVGQAIAEMEGRATGHKQVEDRPWYDPFGLGGPFKTKTVETTISPEDAYKKFGDNEAAIFYLRAKSPTFEAWWQQRLASLAEG